MAERAHADLGAGLLLAADVDARRRDRRRPAPSRARARRRARASRATRARTSSRTAAATALPSMICSHGCGGPGASLAFIERARPARGKPRVCAARCCARLARMRVGVPRRSRRKRTASRSRRAASRALVAHGHAVVVERGAGARLQPRRRRAIATPARRSPTPRRCGRSAEMVLKVKEPLPAEYRAACARTSILFTYLHLAANAGADARAARARACARSPTRRSSSTTARCRCSRR